MAETKRNNFKSVASVRQFGDFIREQGVIGLAVGFILGGSVSNVVSSLVEDIVNPLLGLLLGATDGLEMATVVVGSAVVSYGHFLSVLIDFIVVALVVFFLVKFLRTPIKKK